MIIENNNYYHLYNRSINEETIFYEKENYIFFLKKYSKLSNHISTLAYCLMPTHFHFLVKVTTQDVSKLKRAIGDLQSGYAKAINKELNRHGSLFQQHAKAKHIKSQKQMEALLYITFIKILFAPIWLKNWRIGNIQAIEITLESETVNFYLQMKYYQIIKILIILLSIPI